MDDKKYAISVNKPRRSVRIHLMTCGSRKVHMNKKGNQIHIEDLNLETARKINESYEYESEPTSAFSYLNYKCLNSFGYGILTLYTYL
jgi:hypothetical protein